MPRLQLILQMTPKYKVAYGVYKRIVYKRKKISFVASAPSRIKLRLGSSVKTCRHKLFHTIPTAGGAIIIITSTTTTALIPNFAFKLEIIQL